jgi:hypothetical protein
MVITTSATRVNIHSTEPTPMKSTSLTIHSVTTSVFFHSDSTSRTISSVNVQSRPNLETDRSRHLTPSLMPGIATFKTYRLSADTHGLVFATARFLNYVSTVRAGTPLFASVLANLDFFFCCFVFVLNFF